VTIRWETWAFRAAIGLTLLWIVGFAALVYGRWDEFTPLFGNPPQAIPPGGSPLQRLGMNSIGDVLAGFFAPLAFLWLFIATTLQRIELADTREVLAAQQRELEATAKENAHQTKIMNDTLKATRASVVYSAFEMRLYYVSVLIMERPLALIISWQSYDLRPTMKVPDSRPGIDEVFFRFEENLIHALDSSQRGTLNRVDQPDFVQARLRAIRTQLGSLWHDYAANEIATARMEGIRVVTLIKLCEGAEQHWFKGTA
jgi:hypothetical protein